MILRQRCWLFALPRLRTYSREASRFESIIMYAVEKSWLAPETAATRLVPIYIFR